MKLRKPVKYVFWLIIIVVIGIFVYRNIDKLNNNGDDNSQLLLYSESAMKEIARSNLTDIINKQNYSKTLDAALASGEYNKDFLELYPKIEYKDNKDFIKEINIFLEKKYTADEINNIYSKLRSDNVPKLLKKDYIDLSDYFPIHNFDVDNYDRYVNWNGDKNLSLQDIVTYVNIGLDNEFYSLYKEAFYLDSHLVLVNKYNKLPDDYEPNDLTSLSYDAKYKLRKVAAEAFEEMVKAAENDGSKIYPYSAYRSFATQANLYTTYVNRDGKDLADTYSARPGFSEHQTGLAVDVRSATELSSLSDKDYKWLQDNAYKYGFIIRYPEGMIDITGYMLEQWHLRYIGKDNAEQITKLNITFDEYYDLYIK